VAYVTYPDGVLWRSRPDGSEAVQLTPKSLRAGRPYWSPDGARIAFGGAQEGRPDMVYMVQSTGAAPEAIPPAAYLSGASGWSPAGGASWSPDGKSLVFASTSFAGAPVKAGVYIMDLAKRSARFLEGSAQLMQPVWSPDGRYVVAHRDRAQLLLFDFRTRRWTSLANGVGLVGPYWSRDGKYVYYQEEFQGLEQPISRIHVTTRRVERMTGLKQIPQSSVAGFVLGGMTSEDAPIVSVIRTNSDIYALDLELP